MSQYKPIEGTLIIGIGHKARQGKDTAANYLRTKYGAVKYSFASGLYSVARCLFDMTEKNPRLLQALGTEVGRSHDDQRWIRNLYWQIKDDAPAVAVIPDCRFWNEFDFIKGVGGQCIKVVRFNADETPFIAPDRPATHPSETALDNCEDWDWQIGVLDGDMPNLYAKLDTFMKDMKLLGRYKG